LIHRCHRWGLINNATSKEFRPCSRWFVIPSKLQVTHCFARCERCWMGHLYTMDLVATTRDGELQYASARARVRVEQADSGADVWLLQERLVKCYCGVASDFDDKRSQARAVMPALLLGIILLAKHVSWCQLSTPMFAWCSYLRPLIYSTQLSVTVFSLTPVWRPLSHSLPASLYYLCNFYLL
jgi:hypothetical protein